MCCCSAFLWASMPLQMLFHFFSGICSVLGICSVFMLPIFLVVMEAYMLWLLRVVNYCSTWTLYQLLW